MSSDDLSPSSKPLTSKIHQDLLKCPDDQYPGYDIEPVMALFEYVEMAKRALLEARVRDFTASDVVALAIAMESRARVFMLRGLDNE